MHYDQSFPFFAVNVFHVEFQNVSLIGTIVANWAGLRWRRPTMITDVLNHLNVGKDFTVASWTREWTFWC